MPRNADIEFELVNRLTCTECKHFAWFLYWFNWSFDLSCFCLVVCDTFQLERTKNRYTNIPIPDFSRVPIETGYINANFIPNFNGKIPNYYIATQGPLTNTVADLWQMFWEQNVCVVVLLANEKENGKIKITRYWPLEKATPIRWVLFWFGDMLQNWIGNCIFFLWIILKFWKIHCDVSWWGNA